LLIDDRAKNCEGARVAGMQSLQFRGSAKELEAELDALLPAQQA
jgi:hypothetical protein